MTMDTPRMPSVVDVHTVACAWNALACAAENYRDASPYRDFASLESVVREASGYLRDEMCGCTCRGMAYPRAIAIALRLAMEGESIAAMDLLADAFPTLADRVAGQLRHGDGLGIGGWERD